MNNSIFDPCFNCVVKKVDSVNGDCPLSLCIHDAFEPMGYHNVDIETLVLWEKGCTIEEIQVLRDFKTRGQVIGKITRWRDKKREHGLLV